MLNEKKVKCLHCGEELVANLYSSDAKACKCKKVSLCGGTVVEGVEGKDWVNTSARLLNEAM